MKSPIPKLKPRILIVEDDEEQLKGLISDLNRISEDEKKQYGFEDFEIVGANCAADAKLKLEEAQTAQRPYHLIILDLSLPWDNLSKNDRPENGYQILAIVKSTGAAKGVIVVSVLNLYQNVVRAFRGGAFDFIEKQPRSIRPVLQKQALRCLSDVLIKESEYLFNQRIKNLLPYVGNGLAHRFNATFSDLISSVRRAASEIERHVRDRYGLDAKRDAQDGLMWQLTEHQKAIQLAQDEWAKIQSPLPVSEDEAQEKSIEELLLAIGEELVPALTVKKTQFLFDPPPAGQALIPAFQQDVYSILKEILIGGLSELANYGEQREIKATITAEHPIATICFEDSLFRISKADAEKINEGYSIIADLQLGRVWGLSVAQHIAVRGGGELVIEPQENGNRITYRIPLANHA